MARAAAYGWDWTGTIYLFVRAQGSSSRDRSLKLPQNGFLLGSLSSDSRVAYPTDSFSVCE